MVGTDRLEDVGQPRMFQPPDVVQQLELLALVAITLHSPSSDSSSSAQSCDGTDSLRGHHSSRNSSASPTPHTFRDPSP